MAKTDNLPQITQQQVDELKAACQQCKAVFETTSDRSFAAAGAIDKQEIKAAISDGTFWQKIPQWILRYGPRIFSFIMELLEEYIPQPMNPPTK